MWSIALMKYKNMLASSVNIPPANEVEGMILIIPPAQRSCWGVYWFHSLHPSVRLSIRPASRVHSVVPTVLVGSISYSYILSNNFRRCVACNVYCKISSLNFWQIFQICNFDSCLVLTWDLMWITSMGYHWAAGCISERRRSSCSSFTFSICLSISVVPGNFSSQWFW